jgi:type 2 lantibiotic biosynthesis protein LanM
MTAHAEAAAPGKDRLLETADTIAGTLRQRRVAAKDGSVTWLGPKFSQERQIYAPVPIPPHMYGGTVGIALFFAAAERILGGGEHAALCREAIAPLRRKLAALAGDPERAVQSRIPVAGMTGLGSYVYCFLRIGLLLDDPALVGEAHALTSLFTPERIAGDDTLDVVTGSAGALLALLALHRVIPGPAAAGITPLAAASACARHLLERQSSHEGKPRAWPWPGNEDRSPLAGYSHGAAGIACALLRLYAVTREPALRDAAQEGLEFERTLFSPEHGNWRDLRTPYPRYGSSWCHGAPGVALGRLGALEVAGDETVRGEIRTALDTTLGFEDSWFDYLCCGTMGLAEILFYAHRKLGEPRLLAGAERITDFVLRRFQANGDFGWQPVGWENVYDPSLIRGAAGIGYTLLRFAEPGVLPSVLLFE